MWEWQQLISTPKKYQLKSKIDLQGLGVEPSKFGLHSLRSTGATLVAKKGVNDRVFQRYGRCWLDFILHYKQQERPLAFEYCHSFIERCFYKVCFLRVLLFNFLIWIFRWQCCLWRKVVRGDTVSELCKHLQSCSHHLSYSHLILWFYRVNAASFVLLFISELTWIKNNWRRITLNPPVKQNLRMTFTFKSSLFDIY